MQKPRIQSAEYRNVEYTLFVVSSGVGLYFIGIRYKLVLVVKVIVVFILVFTIHVRRYTLI